MLSYYLTSLGLIPYFTSRAFTPLFASAFIARFAPQFSWFADLEGIRLLSQAPAWAIGDSTLIVLSLLMLVEIGATKSPEIRELLTLFDTKIKAVAAFLVCFAVVRGNPVELIEHVAQAGLSTDFSWGQSFAYTWSFAIGGTVWLTAILRNSVYGFVMELDPDDDLGIQGLLGWLEDVLSFVGVLFVVILPLLALLVFGVTILGLYLVRRYLESREQRSKVPCLDCATPNSQCGIRCAGCGVRRSQVQKVGLMGTIREAMVTDFAAHRMQLLSQKRCPVCGERLKERRLTQNCGGCGIQPFASSREVEQYLSNLRAGLPKTLAILFLLGFVPLLGLIPGVIYYRLSIVASLRAYIPRSLGFVGRWFVRVINLVLICLQPVPILGAFTLPLMCLSNYWVYRALLRGRIRTEFSGRLVPA